MDDASTLCQRCGLCCDGNLFNSVPLADAEVEPVRARGLIVVARGDGGSALRQRCAALGERGCGVYAQRPGRCREYRCMLLVAMMEGEVGLAEALGIVDEAHARIAAVDAPGDGAPLERARRCGEPSAALMFVARHFERRAG